MSTIVIVLILLFLSIWVFGFLYANDLEVKSKSLKDLSDSAHKILVIFPHADDEALSSGGLISGLSNQGIELDWLILTKGERGNQTATSEEKLKTIRIEESKQAAKIYGVKNLFQRDYLDNGVSEYKDKLKEDLRKTLAETKPDLIITYDLSGLYGHPDHIIVSEVVTELIKNEFVKTRLLYVSFPKKILHTMPLPEHMAKDKEYKNKRSYPSIRVWVGIQGVLNKMKAVYTYKSQRQSYLNSFPIKIIPLWFYISLTPYEYFYEFKS